MTRMPLAVRVIGYPPGSVDELVNDYLRTTRRAHAVVERVFGDPPLNKQPPPVVYGFGEWSEVEAFL